jgi:hypothetical protein
LTNSQVMGDAWAHSHVFRGLGGLGGIIVFAVSSMGPVM